MLRSVACTTVGALAKANVFVLLSKAMAWPSPILSPVHVAEFSDTRTSSTLPLGFQKNAAFQPLASSSEYRYSADAPSAVLPLKSTRWPAPSSLARVPVF